MPQLEFLVYAPSHDGMPYLAVALSPDRRQAIAAPFPTEEEAEAYKESHAAWTFAALREQSNA